MCIPWKFDSYSEIYQKILVRESGDEVLKKNVLIHKSCWVHVCIVFNVERNKCFPFSFGDYKVLFYYMLRQNPIEYFFPQLIDERTKQILHSVRSVSDVPFWIVWIACVRIALSPYAFQTYLYISKQVSRRIEQISRKKKKKNNGFRRVFCKRLTWSIPLTTRIDERVLYSYTNTIRVNRHVYAITR